jgi:hypothetical protein
MLKKTLLIFCVPLLLATTVVCSLGGSGTAEADLVASLGTNTPQAVDEAMEMVEDETIVLTPTPTPAPEAIPTPEPTIALSAALGAQEIYDLALAEALTWHEDAVVTSLSTTIMGPLQADGAAESWSLTFYSPSAKEMLTVPFINGALTTPPAVALPTDPGAIPAMDNVILDLSGLYQTAADAGGDKFTGDGYYLMAGLTRYPLDENMPTWYMNYHDATNNTVVFTVIIDARSGEVIQAIDVGGS